MIAWTIGPGDEDWGHDHPRWILSILSQLLPTTSIRNVWRQERRICILISGIKGFSNEDVHIPLVLVCNRRCTILLIDTIWLLKCYYDQKITFNFSSDFETMFIKHSPSEIISLNFEKKTVNLNCNFRFNGPPLLHQKGYNDVIHARAVKCSVWTRLTNYAKHEFESVKAQNSRAAY